MLGYASEIFVINLHEQMRNEGKNFSPFCLRPAEGIIYHHSIGSEITPYAMSHPGPKCLIYHNITPPEFFAPYRPGFAWLLERGLIDLSRLAKHFSLSAGDSTFNAMSLAEAGFDAPEVLPIIVNPDRWQIDEDRDLLEKLLDGRTNLLFVGRIAPNKCQDRLIEAFAQYRTFDENSRLILVGEGKPFDPYFQKLRRRILELKLTNQVIITGHVSDAQLMSYYKAADLFWSFSEHEGFCVPIVEAMWFDIPVLALKSTAIAETLGGAGILFENEERLPEVVALARKLVFDERFKSEIMTAQRQRREAFLPKAIWPHLDRIVERMERVAIAMKSKST
jgi:glycosyltransferase involved in cell wall biosynthesis